MMITIETKTKSGYKTIKTINNNSIAKPFNSKEDKIFLIDKDMIQHVDRIIFTTEKSLVMLLMCFTCLPEFIENENGHIEFTGSAAKFIAKTLHIKNS